MSQTVDLLCRESSEALERARSSRLFEIENWRTLRLELDKLGFLLQKLARELRRMRESAKNS